MAPKKMALSSRWKKIALRDSYARALAVTSQISPHKIIACRFKVLLLSILQSKQEVTCYGPRIRASFSPCRAIRWRTAAWNEVYCRVEEIRNCCRPSGAPRTFILETMLHLTMFHGSPSEILSTQDIDNLPLRWPILNLLFHSFKLFLVPWSLCEVTKEAFYMAGGSFRDVGRCSFCHFNCNKPFPKASSIFRLFWDSFETVIRLLARLHLASLLAADIPTTSELRTELVAARAALSDTSDRMAASESRGEDAENRLRTSFSTAFMTLKIKLKRSARYVFSAFGC